ncbi:MAG: hypothetical protein ACI4OT_05750 [Bacilli bacterium]
MDIFNKNNNIHLISLNNYELYSLLSSINNYKLIYKETLNIKNDFTFSPEIEFISRSKKRAEKIFNKDIKDNWKIKEELTIGNGFEICPYAFLNNNKKDFSDINNILKTIKKDPFSGIDYSCGLHLNIGNHIFDNETHLKNFITLFLAYEEVIFRFCYGDYLNPRYQLLISSVPLRNNINNDIDYIYNLIRNSKGNCISLNKFKSFDYEYNNVMEIRCPNATYNPITLQNNLNLFLNMIENGRNIDNELLERKINNKKHIELPSYNKIFLNEALEFVDMVFDNNLDKVYFLKQYLKNNKEIEFDSINKKMIKYKKL